VGNLAGNTYRVAAGELQCPDIKTKFASQADLSDYPLPSGIGAPIDKTCAQPVIPVIHRSAIFIKKDSS